MQSAEQLVTGVIEHVGLSDLGRDTFMTGLCALLESIERDAHLDDLTLAQVEASFRHRIENRLRVEEWYAHGGAAVDDTIESPLSIMGLPRTGTTALGNTLSLDPRFRPLRLWEQLDPCGPERFLDVHHRELVANPMGTTERIYDFVGLELDQATRDAIERWHATNRSGAHGVHRYTSEEFGLRDDQLRSDFAFYTDEYDIELEEMSR